MKPESDEQIDTLWGQNMADNLAVFWTRDRLLTSINTIIEPGGASRDYWGTVFFKKYSPWDRIHGTIVGTNGASSGADQHIRLWVNSVEIASGTMAWGASEEKGFTYDSSSLSDDTEYKLSWLIENDQGQGLSWSTNIWEGV